MAFPSKKEEEGGLNSFYNNKTTVIQEARVFNDSPISPRKCRLLLTRIVYMLYIGETFTTQEATTLFFGTTKLFQHKDVRFFVFPPRPNFLFGCLECVAASCIPGYQGIGSYSGRCNYGHKQYHEGHAAQLRGDLPAKFNPRLVSHHRRMSLRSE